MGASGSILLDPASVRVLAVNRGEPCFSESVTVGGSFMYQ
jgi:hypothetical protein